MTTNKETTVAAKNGSGTLTPRAALKAAIEGKTAPEAQRILVPKPDLRSFTLKLEGLSPLLVNKWSEKAMRQIQESQSGAPKTRKRAARDPEAEFKASVYEHPEGGYGFPASSFRLAAVSACRLVDGLTMTQARCLFVVTEDLVRIKGPKPQMDTRPVRLANGSADLRYRGLFWPWSTEITIRYNAAAVGAEQIVNLMVLAGECIGIGELRPEKGGNNGRFTVGA